MYRSQRLTLGILGLVCMLSVSGIGALQCTTTGSGKTATGNQALRSNTTGAIAL